MSSAETYVTKANLPFSRAQTGVHMCCTKYGRFYAEHALIALVVLGTLANAVRVLVSI